MSKGYVYALVNEAMPGIVKIGRTERDVVQRANELYQTGVPLPFKIAHSVYVPDCKMAEADLHHAFQDSRINTGREFFAADIDDVICVMEEVREAQVIGFVYEFAPSMSLIDSDRLSSLIALAREDECDLKAGDEPHREVIQ